MSKVNLVHYNTMRKAFINHINQYLMQCCKDMCEEYKRENHKLSNDENMLRNILVEEFLNEDNHRNKHEMTDFRFESESQENYDYSTKKYKGRCDIKVIYNKDYFKKKEGYYLVECKRIDGKNKLNKQFVDEGVLRFVTGKYSSYYRYSTMLGFIVKHDINIYDNYQKIIDYQDEIHLDSLQEENVVNDNMIFHSTRLFSSQQLHMIYMFCNVSQIIEN
ncbi:MAG: hypothetical protein LUG60_14155 [Erysipelotrichaceae bacterium]|nr:hypothetical protein [Erysipelotrichaceae bacterium]